jgi:hypothetical protein
LAWSALRVASVWSAFFIASVRSQFLGAFHNHRLGPSQFGSSRPAGRPSRPLRCARYWGGASARSKFRGASWSVSGRVSDPSNDAVAVDVKLQRLMAGTRTLRVAFLHLAANAVVSDAIGFVREVLALFPLLLILCHSSGVARMTRQVAMDKVAAKHTGMRLHCTPP